MLIRIVLYNDKQVCTYSLLEQLPRCHESFLHFLQVFIPQYFILFDVMGNGIVASMSFSAILLLAYRNANIFYKYLESSFITDFKRKRRNIKYITCFDKNKVSDKT